MNPGIRRDDGNSFAGMTAMDDGSARSMTEFELIARYFDRPVQRARLGIGDDCALLAPHAGHELAVSTDMLVADRHFFSDGDPAALGWKSLAVNLSDLAAMGAQPLAFTLALALPDVDEEWLSHFAGGLFECAQRFDCELVGGDTTRGPLNICITVFGEVAEGRALRRDGAKACDDVWVSGVVGDAALALARARAARVAGARDLAIHDAARVALERPMPRIALGLALRGIATSAIDVSDGLAQDLGHLLAASKLGATLGACSVPVSETLAREGDDVRYRCALAGGDDYQLCFTAPRARRDAVEDASRKSATRVTRVGVIDADSGLRFVDANGADFRFPDGLTLHGFDHFA